MSARYNAVRWGFGTGLRAEGGKLVDAHSDNLEDGEQDGRGRHDGYELQHGRDIGRYLGRGGYPAQRIVARAASYGLRAMKNTSVRRDQEARHSAFYGIQTVRAGVQGRDNCFHAMATYSSHFQLHPMSYCRVSGLSEPGKANMPTFSPKTTTITTQQYILPQPSCQLQHSSKSFSSLSNRAMYARASSSSISPSSRAISTNAARTPAGILFDDLSTVNIRADEKPK